MISSWFYKSSIQCILEIWILKNRLQVSQRPETGARWRGDSCRKGSPFCRHPPAVPEKSQEETLAHPRRADPGHGGWRPTR